MNSHKTRKVHLYSKRVNVELHNAHELNSMGGENTYFHSKEGQNVHRKLRHSINILPLIALKVDAPVILIVNLSEELVNGLDGYVKGFPHSAVHVYFPVLKQVVEITYFDFYRHCHRSGKDILMCSQIPLMLSFALTIHRCQGMTLPSVALHCEGAFQPGQIGVGISNVCDAAHISVYGFRRSLCPPQPHKVQLFSANVTHTTPYIDTNLSCCRRKENERIESEYDIHALNQGIVHHDGDDEMDDNHKDVNDDDDDDDDDDDIDVLIPNDLHAATGSHESHVSIDDLPDDLKPHALRTKLMYEDPFTDTQKHINSILTNISDMDQDTYGSLRTIDE